MPAVDKVLDRIRDRSIFLKLDLKSGDSQIKINVKDNSKMGLCTHEGYYKVKLMLFGLI